MIINGVGASLADHIHSAPYIRAIFSSSGASITCKNADSHAIHQLYTDYPGIRILDEYTKITHKVGSFEQAEPGKIDQTTPTLQSVASSGIAPQPHHWSINIKNTTAAENKWKDLLRAICFQDYVVVHDEPGAVLDHDYAKYMIHLHNHQSFPIVYISGHGSSRYNYPLISGLNNPTHLRKIATGDPFELITIMKHAKAVHMIDGPYAALLDQCVSANTSQLKVMYGPASAPALAQVQAQVQSNYKSNWIYYTSSTNPYSDEP